MSEDLKAPTLLLAMPRVLDPFFYRAVVLLLAHGDDGSLGLVVNRPADLKIAAVLEDMNIRWGGDPETNAFVGGPVQPQIGSVLYAAEEMPDSDTLTEVIPGVALTQHLDDLAHLASMPPPRLRLILGYAGWSSGQLMEEFLRNDWLSAPIDSRLLFHEDPERAWEEGLRSLGVDPATLATWNESDDVAN